MKKVIGVALAAAILATVLPASANAAQSGPVGIKTCKASFLRPCPNTMPPSSSGSNNGWHRGGGNTGSGSGSGTSRGNSTGTRPLPPTGGR
jgi:uncharacterized membrane protein YgcG